MKKQKKKENDRSKLKDRLKKALSFTMSVIMLAGLPLPVMAEQSSMSGQDSEITAALFQRDAYTIINGSSLALYDELLAFVSPQLLVQNPVVEWSIENDNNFAFTIDIKGNVFANENEGSAVITAILNKGDVTAEVTVTAAKKAPELKANGFKFAESAQTLLIGADAANLQEDQVINISATPENAVFTQAQLDALILSLQAEVDKGSFDLEDDTIAVRPIVIRSTNKASLVYPVNAAPSLSAITADRLAAKTFTFTMPDFPLASSSNSTRQISRSISISCEPARIARAIGSADAITIEVGAKISTADHFRQTPGDANAELKVTYGRDFAAKDLSEKDYAVFTDNILDPSEIIGVAVGKSKITASVTNSAGEVKTASLIVSVIERDFTKPLQNDSIEGGLTEGGLIEGEMNGTVPKTGTLLLKRLF